MPVTQSTRRALGSVPGVRKAVTGVEGLASVRAVLRAGWFDLAWYEAQTGRRWASTTQAVAHYVAVGRRAGLAPHPLFEPAWVEPQTWRTVRTDPLTRFVGRAAASDVSPHPLFDPQEWVRRHPEAADHPRGAFGHLVDVLDDDTALPPVPALRAAGAGDLRWGDVRAHLLAVTREWREHEALLGAERVSDSHEDEAASAFVRAWSQAPLPRMEGPAVSVVMPVLDRATTVVAAIASVQAQTMREWELVVVDDGSSDNTPEVVEQLCAHDPRIRLVRGPRAGVSAARNLGARHATGRYLAWLDSDNTWTPDFLRTATAAMHARGLRAAYAQSELVGRTGTRYRALDAGTDHLAVRNHVDLNVLVADRLLVEDIGGFDEGLRRTVDYDLVWRLGRRCEVVHLPFVGVVYDDDEDDDGRITTTELFSWKEVVRSKHLVDWEAARAAAPRVGTTSVVVTARTSWSGAWATATTSLTAEAGSVEVVVVDDAASRGTGAVLASLELALPAVRRVRLAATGLDALAWNVGAGHAGGDVLVFVDGATTPARDWLPPLRAALVDASGAAAQPLVVAADGSVHSAGGFWAPYGQLPVRFLGAYPVEDAARVAAARGERLPVDLVDTAPVAVRREDFLALGGFDCLFVGGWQVPELSLRLAAATGRPGATVSLSSQVTLGPPDDTPGGRRRELADRELFLGRGGGRRGTGGPWSDVGVDVVRWTSDAPGWIRGAVRSPAPVLVRRERKADDGTPCLRWAIKTATPPGPEAHKWGDEHFARSLAQALERLGQQVSVDYRTTLRRRTRDLDDVNLVLRGLLAVPAEVGATNLLWVISHPELVTDDELRTYDGVFAASLSWADAAARRVDREVVPLLQATDPRRFRPDAAEPDTGERVLFVGNSRNVYRPVVRHLVETDHEVSVYGGRWDQFLPPGYLRGEHVANARLAPLYRSAGVVLNDHWDDMREQGFVSNRLFDAAAAGARVVTDDVAGVDELFGGLVRTYRDPGQLRQLVEGYREAFPGEQERVRLAHRVRAEHSFDARARTLLDEALRRRG